ncbi:MAG: aminotransferase class IV [Phycisphaerales bacterium]|nr:aminotransferase class IV [Phycisphaerales bacterium]
MCAREGIPAVERTLTADDLRGADEVFLSSTLRDIWPVVALDGRELRRPGSESVVARLAPAFETYSDQLLRERYAPIWARLTRAEG